MIDFPTASLELRSGGHCLCTLQIGRLAFGSLASAHSSVEPIFVEDTRPKVTICICAHCREPFPRHYKMFKSRWVKPQFCSRSCHNARRSEDAEKARLDRFWSKVDRSSSGRCWPWKAARNAHGYGTFRWGPKEQRLAHRVAYEIATGVAPGFEDVCHSCDNPACCNPEHLWLGDAKANVADMIQKGRARRGHLRGEQASKTKLTREQAIEVFQSQEDFNNLADRFGVTRSAIYNIKTGKSWAHATGASPHKRLIGGGIALRATGERL